MGETIQQIKLALSMSGDQSVGTKLSRIVEVLAQIKASSHEASKATKGTSKSIEETGKSSSKAVKGLKAFLKALMRVAVYRFIRSIIRELSEALKEGVENVYMYSKAMNGLDATNVKGSLDSVATSVLYLKNALGAALTPVIQALTPHIAALADWFADLANSISKALGALIGNSYYTAAKKFGTTYEESLSSATESAKELKKTLMGFDEINRLDDNSSSSSSSGYSTEDYLGMFDKLEIEDSYSKKIKKIFTTVAEIAGGALIGLGTILLFTPGCGLTGVGLIAAGMALTLSPIVFNDDLRKKVEDNLGLIELAASGAALALGAALAFSGASLPVGLALMVLGAANLATQTRENWDTVPDGVKRALKEVGLALSLVGFVIGAIMTLTGANIPLGIALMGASAAAFYGTSSSLGLIDWSAIPNKLGEALDRAKEIVTTKLAELKAKFEGWKAKMGTPHFSWTTKALEPGTLKYKILDALGLPTSLPKLDIDWYAKGGIVDGASLIGAGERGAEAIVPLENNTEWLDKIADRLIQAQGEQSITLNVDGKALFDILVDRNNSMVRRTGHSKLLV